MVPTEDRALRACTLGGIIVWAKLIVQARLRYLKVRSITHQDQLHGIGWVHRKIQLQKMLRSAARVVNGAWVVRAEKAG